MSKSKSPDDMEHTFTHVEPSPPSYHEADSEVGSFRVLRPFSSSGLPPSTEERADKLRAALRQRLLDYRWRRKPINVLLLGPAGVGKSCFLNSAIRAFRKVLLNVMRLRTLLASFLFSLLKNFLARYAKY